ncbi:hypothetical protein GC207_02875 [bacterium]|nr:hypothetical protein [bacterium]
MIRLPYQRLEIPSFRRAGRPGFVLRLLKYRWRVLALSFLFIAGPVILAMWIVPYAASVTIKVKDLGPGGILTNQPPSKPIVGF